MAGLKAKVGAVWSSAHYISIRVTPTYDYDIEISQIQEDVLTGRINWLFHLGKKTWFTESVRKNFMDECRKRGIELTSNQH